ncbi:MAG TPA: MFS transporter, partial [Anaerolineae bacterium]|nr:MFS transporter [Anaerolineae bacterium]
GRRLGEVAIMARQREQIDVVNPEDKLDFKKIMPIFVIVLIDLLGLTIIIPLMALYATSFGADAFTIGLLGAAYPIMQFIGAPLLGRLSDRYGRKPILLVSQIGTLIGFIVLGLAGSLPLLFIARLIDGLSGANISTAQAVITDSTTARTRTQGLGLLGAAFGLGFVVGPVLAFLSLAISNNNYHVPAFVAAGFSAISIGLTWFWLEETHGPEKRGTDPVKGVFSIGAIFKALSHPTVGLLLLLMFAQQIAFGGFEQILALFTLNRLGMNASSNSILFVFVGIIVVAVQDGLIGKWSRKWGDRKLVYIGLATLAIGMALTALTPSQTLPGYSKAELTAELTHDSNFRTHETPVTRELPVAIPEDGNSGPGGLVWLLVAMIPASIGGGVLQPSINSLITKRIAPSEIGGTLGISAALLSGANVFAPLIGGGLFQAGGSSLPFWVWAIIMAALLAAAYMLIKPGREEQAPSGLARGGAAAH